MSDEANAYLAPATSIVLPPIPRRRPVLRWSTAVFCGLCGVISLLVTYFIAGLLINRANHSGWSRFFFELLGPARSSLVLFSLTMTAASGVLFFLASRNCVKGQPRRAGLWFLAAFGAGCFMPFLFR